MTTHTGSWRCTYCAVTAWRRVVFMTTHTGSWRYRSLLIVFFFVIEIVASGPFSLPSSFCCLSRGLCQNGYQLSRGLCQNGYQVSRGLCQHGYQPKLCLRAGQNSRDFFLCPQTYKKTLPRNSNANAYKKLISITIYSSTYQHTQIV